MLLLGVLAAQAEAAAPAAAGSYDLLETEILTGTQASVTFSSSNSTYGADYQHLQLRMTLRATTSNNINFQFNGDTGSNYKSHFLYGDGSSAGSGYYPTNTKLYLGNTSNTTNVFSGVVVDILDPFETTKNTTTRALYGDTSVNVVQLLSGAWFNTAALTSILITQDSGSYTTGSRFSLYGLRSA